MMEVIRHSTGGHIGAISVVSTLRTMEVGESWVTNMQEVDFAYCQVCASRFGLTTGRKYQVSSPKEFEGKIVITRLA